MIKASAVAKIVGLLLLLPAGGLVFFFLSGVARHRYDDSGFGSFHGLVNANLLYFGTEHSFSAKIEGKSPARWHWMPPTNYQYRTLSFDWSGEGGEGSGQIDTSSLNLNVDGNIVPVSSATLSDLLFGVSPTGLGQKDVEAIRFLEGLIVKAGEGHLAAPRHHYYHFETPLSGTMAHFSLGPRFPYSLLWWAGVWCFLCLWIATRARARQTPKDDGVPSNSSPSSPLPESADIHTPNSLRPRSSGACR